MTKTGHHRAAFATPARHSPALTAGHPHLAGSYASCPTESGSKGARVRVAECLSSFGTKCPGEVPYRNVAERGHFLQMGQRSVGIESLAYQPHAPWCQPTGAMVVFFAPQLELTDDLDSYLLGERFQDIGGSEIGLLHLAVHAAK